jgi:hypothetical protein
MHVVPALFPHDAWRPVAASDAPDVDTPLGALTTTARVDDHVLRPEAARRYDDGADARLWVWEGGVFRAELLRVRLADAPSGDDATREAVLWRLDAHERPAECRIACGWRAPLAAAPARARRDDGLAGWEWTADGWRAALATPALDGAARLEGEAVIVGAPLERGARFETRFLVGWWPSTGDASRLVVRTPAQLRAALGERTR